MHSLGRIQVHSIYPRARSRLNKFYIRAGRTSSRSAEARNDIGATKEPEGPKKSKKRAEAHTRRWGAQSKQRRGRGARAREPGVATLRIFFVKKVTRAGAIVLVARTR